MNSSAINDKLLFLGSDLASGRELWASNGTVAGTELLLDIDQGTANSFAEHKVVVDDKLFYTTIDSNERFELWVFDGVRSRFLSRFPGQPVTEHAVGNLAMFTFYLPVLGSEPQVANGQVWSSDGTPEGTQLVFSGVGTAVAANAADQLFFRFEINRATKTYGIANTSSIYFSGRPIKSSSNSHQTPGRHFGWSPLKVTPWLTWRQGSEFQTVLFILPRVA